MSKESVPKSSALTKIFIGCTLQIGGYTIGFVILLVFLAFRYNGQCYFFDSVKPNPQPCSYQSYMLDLVYGLLSGVVIVLGLGWWIIIPIFLIGGYLIGSAYEKMILRRRRNR